MRRCIRAKAAIILVLCAAGCSKPRLPSLSVPKLVYLGDVEINAIKHADFTIENPSDHAITIQNISTTCACTSVKLEGDKRLPPHARRTVTASINFGELVGAHGTNIVFTWDDGQDQIAKETVSAQANVVALFVLEQSLVDFGNVNVAGGPQTMTVKAREGGAKVPWDTLAFEEGGTALKISAEKTGPSAWAITLRLDAANLPLAAFRQPVKVRAVNRGDPLPGYVPLMVVGQVTGSLHAEPGTLYVSAVATSSIIERAMTISSTEDSFGQLAINTDSPDVETHVTELLANRAVVHVRMTAPAKSGAFSRRITVSATNSRSKLLINLFGMAQASAR